MLDGQKSFGEQYALALTSELPLKPNKPSDRATVPTIYVLNALELIVSYLKFFYRIS
jgi:hypothetical protein